MTDNRKFIAYAKENDAGCGYTIGCAQKLWRLEASCLADAIEELKLKVTGEWDNEHQEYDGGCLDFELEELVLFEIVNEEEMPFNSWYLEAKRNENQEKHNDK